MQAVIREATESDVGNVVRMGCDFMEKTPYREQIKPDLARMETLARNLIGSPEGRIFVVEMLGKLVGMIVLLLYYQPFSGQRIAAELAWWMSPEARGTSAGVRLQRRAEEWARSSGAEAFDMVAPNEHVASFYRRLGYVHVEDTYRLNLGGA